MKSQFKYDSHEFFYDKSFSDYPLTELYDIVDNYVAIHSISWAIIDHNYHKTFSGNELKHIAPYLLQANDFAGISLSNFTDHIPINHDVRVVQFPKDIKRLQLHSGLKIISFTIQTEIANAKFCPTLKTFNIFMTASFETIPDLFL